MCAPSLHFLFCSNNRLNSQKAEQLKIEPVCSLMSGFIQNIQYLALNVYCSVIIRMQICRLTILQIVLRHANTHQNKLKQDKISPPAVSLKGLNFIQEIFLSILVS